MESEKTIIKLLVEMSESLRLSAIEARKQREAIEKISEVLCKPISKHNTQTPRKYPSPYDCGVTLEERGGHAKKKSPCRAEEAPYAGRGRIDNA